MTFHQNSVLWEVNLDLVFRSCRVSDDASAIKSQITSTKLESFLQISCY